MAARSSSTRSATSCWRVQLLRGSVQTGTFGAGVGGTEPIHVDVRIVAATNKRLEDEVKAGRFRSDLFYRMTAFVLGSTYLRSANGSRTSHCSRCTSSTSSRR